MAETLGSLCDKLTIVKLKQYHSEDTARLESLSTQEKNLCEEIDTYLGDAISGKIPLEKLTFASNKVYTFDGQVDDVVSANIGGIFAELAQANCDVWHEQEKLYAFEKVPAGEKDTVMKKLAALNLRRNHCIDAIDQHLQQLVRDANRGHVQGN